MYIYIYINIYIHTYIYTVADRVHWLHSHNLDSRNLVRRLHATYRSVRREREEGKRERGGEERERRGREREEGRT